MILCQIYESYHKYILCDIHHCKNNTLILSVLAVNVIPTAGNFFDEFILLFAK